jgi:DNA replicative helicase MCM subunit Mcm2 (Cdc46/Mcm family)
MIIHLRPGDDMELERLMSEHILSASLGHQVGPADISFEEMRHFITCASRTEIELSAECQQLLRAFFLSSRKIRENSYIGTEISLVTMESLVRMAGAHAKVVYCCPFPKCGLFVCVFYSFYTNSVFIPSSV